MWLQADQDQSPATRFFEEQKEARVRNPIVNKTLLEYDLPETVEALTSIQELLSWVEKECSIEDDEADWNWGGAVVGENNDSEDAATLTDSTLGLVIDRFITLSKDPQINKNSKAYIELIKFLFETLKQKDRLKNLMAINTVYADFFIDLTNIYLQNASSRPNDHYTQQNVSLSKRENFRMTFDVIPDLLLLILQNIRWILGPNMHLNTCTNVIESILLFLESSIIFIKNLITGLIFELLFITYNACEGKLDVLDCLKIMNNKFWDGFKVFNIHRDANGYAHINDGSFVVPSTRYQFFKTTQENEDENDKSNHTYTIKAHIMA